MGVVLISEITDPVVVTVFHIQDNLNMGNIQEMVQASQSAFNAGTRKIILDFEKIQFISSAGIRGLMQIFHIFNQVETNGGPEQSNNSIREEKENCNLRLCNCSPMIFKTLNIAAVTDVIPISTSLEEAIHLMSS